MANELSVISKAKNLCDYIMTVTERSPKRFRFTLVSRLQNYSLDVITALISANEIFVRPGMAPEELPRRKYTLSDFETRYDREEKLRILIKWTDEGNAGGVPDEIAVTRCLRMRSAPMRCGPTGRRNTCCSTPMRSA